MSAPAYAQCFNRFAESAIAITVVPTMSDGRLRMMPSSDDFLSQQAFSRLGDELLGLAPKTDAIQQRNWVAGQLDRILDVKFSDDVWYGQLNGACTIVLVKDAVARVHGRDRALRRVHTAEVMDAARAGAFIPDDVAAEYKSELSRLRAQSPMSS